MVVHLNETFPKDINGNYNKSLQKNSLDKCKKFFHFAEIEPSTETIIPNVPSSIPNQPSKGVTSVLLGPPSEDEIINYQIDHSVNTENDVTKTLIISEDYPSSKLHQVDDNLSDQMIGHTVSVSTCTSCGTESKPLKDYRPVDQTFGHLTQSIDQLKGVNGKSSSRSTPIKDYHLNSCSISAHSMKSLSSSSLFPLPPPPPPPPPSRRPKTRTYQLKGCHICNQLPPSTSSLTPARKKKPDNCPYSIVLGSFHPTIKARALHYRSGNGLNQSTGSKEATRRALIMIFTITSILLFLMVTYYGAIIYLRLRNSSNQNYTD